MLPPMDRKASFKTSVCSEYEALLYTSKSALDEFRAAFETSSDAEGRKDESDQQEPLTRLKEKYERAYTRLIQHFDQCELCKISQKSKNKNPPHPDRVIPFRRRSA